MPMLFKPKKFTEMQICLLLTISEESLPNSRKKSAVVISPLINLIQGPCSPFLIKAFNIVPGGMWFCTSHSTGSKIRQSEIHC